MADNKKRLNITVKKSTPPFLFPESNLAVKDSVQYVNSEDGSSVRRMQTVVPFSGMLKGNENYSIAAAEKQVTEGNSNSLLVKIADGEEQQPVKRKRGRPRLNKEGANGSAVSDNTVSVAASASIVSTPIATATSGTALGSPVVLAAGKQKQSKSLFSNITLGSTASNGAIDAGKAEKSKVGETEQTDELTGIKKRGRKPKNQATGSGSTVDRVYGLNNSSKNAMDLENLENLSYIVNLKITKEKVEQIIEELVAEATYEANKSSPTSTLVSTSTPTPALVSASASAPAYEKVGTMSLLERYEIRSENVSDFTVDSGFASASVTSLDVRQSAAVAATECNGSSVCSKCAGSLSTSVELSQIEYNINSEAGLVGQGYLDCYIGELMPGFIAKEETESGSHKRWPTTSKYPCRNCDETFSTVPAGLVQKIFGDFEMDPMRCKFFLYLNFCNWSCAARYAFDRMPDWVNQHNMMNLCYNMIKKKIDPKHLWRKVEMAPSLGNLARNGGELSIEQYRRAADTNIIYTLYIEPLIPLRMTLEETTVNPRSTSNRAANKTASSKEKVVMLDKSRVMKAEQSIKNRKEGSRVNTIDRLMKVEVRV